MAATSIAWGQWAQESEMTGGLRASDLARIGRYGVRPMSVEAGLELFDRVQTEVNPWLLALRIDAAVLRDQARKGFLPTVMGGLVRVRAKRAGEARSLVRRLARTPAGERQAVVLEVVRAEVAAVLGHPTPETIDPDCAFKDLGFDSLAAIELRNRLGAIAGARLPATMVFDHPNTAQLARYLYREVDGTQDGEADATSGEARIRAALASIPIARLRDAGVLEMLLQLADPSAASAQTADLAMVDAMDAESLVKTAMSRAGEVS
jgi:polyketide synthase 12